MLLSYLFTTLTCFVAITVAREAILGGDICNPGTCIYMVSIQHNRQHLCGGGIIGKKSRPYILTVAHCFFDETHKFIMRSTFILAGSYNMGPNSRGVQVQVRKVYIPNQFDSRYNKSIHDIAVLELNHILPMDLNMLALKLPDTDEKYADHERAQIAGWGWQYVIPYNQNNRTMYHEGRLDDNLLIAEAEILGRNNSHNCPVDLNPQRQLCARIPQELHRVRGVCGGDGGSPLVIRGNHVIGLVSKHPVGCTENVIGATYTKVAYYRKFIEAILNQKKLFMRSYAIVYQLI